MDDALFDSLDVYEEEWKTIVVIKPTLVAKLETDVARYSQKNESFPQQPTADQWFDEGQFESYRRLGELSGDAAAEAIREGIGHGTLRV